MQPSPKTAPQVSEEAEASFPPKEKATKRKIKIVWKTINIISNSGYSEDPSPAPKTRKPTPKKRKSTKKASVEAASTKTPPPAHDAPAPVNPSIGEASIPQKSIPQGENPQEPAKEVAQTKEKTPKHAKCSRKSSKGESSAQVEQPPVQPTTPLSPAMTPEELQQEVNKDWKKLHDGQPNRLGAYLKTCQNYEGSTI